MTPVFAEPDHATPLTPEEQRDLIPSHISNRSELNEAEQDNILRAQDWAGAFRQIPVALRQLLSDVSAWIEFNSYPADEISVRFHHRLVAIHPFANGNGRHSRLMADLLIMQLGGERFTWGSASLRETGETRARYIAALQAADRHECGPLIAFARS